MPFPGQGEANAFLNKPFQEGNRLRDQAVGNIDDPFLRAVVGGIVPRVRLPPTTVTRTSHALTIHGAGRRRGIIGAVHALSVSQTRQVDEEFEVDVFGHGRPIELVPQNLTARTMQINRYDLYHQVMEEVFGDELIDLTDQSSPFSLRTAWGAPLLQKRRIYEYTGCYFTNLGRQASADDNRIVNVDATLVWTRRRKVL